MGKNQGVSLEGKTAFSRFQRLSAVEKAGNHFSLLKVEIFTGRKHQIRVHCAQSLGCPVFGDAKYRGGEKNRIFLHAFSCVVKNNRFIAQLHDEFLDTLNELGFQIDINKVLTEN